MFTVDVKQQNNNIYYQRPKNYQECSNDGLWLTFILRQGQICFLVALPEKECAELLEDFDEKDGKYNQLNEYMNIFE